MFFWIGLLVFTFMALVLSLYPRTDAVRKIDMPQAQSLVAPFVAQHAAALRAVKTKTADDQFKYVVEMSAAGSDFLSKSMFGDESIGALNLNAIARFLPPGMGVDNSFTSYVLCVNNMTKSTSSVCGLTKKTDLSLYTTSDFLITYGPIPTYFGEYFTALSPRALGEQLFLTDYSERYHLPAVCGVLVPGQSTAPANASFEPGSTCLVDTTRYDDVTVPQVFCDHINVAAHNMICVSRLSVAYDTNVRPPQLIYPGTETPDSGI